MLTIDQSLQYEVEQVAASRRSPPPDAKGGDGDRRRRADRRRPRDGDGRRRHRHRARAPRAPRREQQPAAHRRLRAGLDQQGRSRWRPRSRTGSSRPTPCSTTPDQRSTSAAPTYEDVEPTHPSTMTVADILRQSSNVGTIKIAHDARQGAVRRVPATRSASARRRGLGFPGESTGILLAARASTTTRAWRRCRSATASRSRRCRCSTCTRRSPTAAMAAPAAPGRRDRSTPTASAHDEAPPRRRARSCRPRPPPRSRDDARRRSWPTGPARRRRSPGYRVAGKTGHRPEAAVRQPPYRYIASFAGLRPGRRAPPRRHRRDRRAAGDQHLRRPRSPRPCSPQIMQYALACERVPTTS